MATDAMSVHLEFIRPTVTCVSQVGCGPYPRSGSIFTDTTRHTYEDQITINQIREFAEYGEDWDGFGGIRFLPNTISNATRTVTTLSGACPSPDAIPNPNGTITLEWETDIGFANIEIGATRFSFYLRTESGHVVMLDGDALQLYDSTYSKQISSIIKSSLYPTQAHSISILGLGIGTGIYATPDLHI